MSSARSLIIVAVIALVLGTGGGAVAGAVVSQGMVTGGPEVGAPGAGGPEGPPGVDGTAGEQGPTGATGSTGPAGPAGSAGRPGAPGLMGPPGAAGVDGGLGPAGAQGPAGVQGQAGAEGPAGPAGADGLVSFGLLFFTLNTPVPGDSRVALPYDSTVRGTLDLAVADGDRQFVLGPGVYRISTAMQAIGGVDEVSGWIEVDVTDLQFTAQVDTLSRSPFTIVPSDPIVSFSTSTFVLVFNDSSVEIEVVADGENAGLTVFEGRVLVEKFS